jgi:hypothetical protein
MFFPTIFRCFLSSPYFSNFPFDLVSQPQTITRCRIKQSASGSPGTWALSFSPSLLDYHFYKIQCRSIGEAFAELRGFVITIGNMQPHLGRRYAHLLKNIRPKSQAAASQQTSAYIEQQALPASCYVSRKSLILSYRCSNRSSITSSLSLLQKKLGDSSACDRDISCMKGR